MQSRVMKARAGSAEKLDQPEDGGARMSSAAVIATSQQEQHTENKYSPPMPTPRTRYRKESPSSRREPSDIKAADQSDTASSKSSQRPPRKASPTAPPPPADISKLDAAPTAPATPHQPRTPVTAPSSASTAPRATPTTPVIYANSATTTSKPRNLLDSFNFASPPAPTATPTAASGTTEAPPTDDAPCKSSSIGSAMSVPVGCSNWLCLLQELPLVGPNGQQYLVNAMWTTKMTARNQMEWIWMEDPNPECRLSYRMGALKDYAASAARAAPELTGIAVLKDLTPMSTDEGCRVMDVVQRHVLETVADNFSVGSSLTFLNKELEGLGLITITAVDRGHYLFPAAVDVHLLFLDIWWRLPRGSFMLLVRETTVANGQLTPHLQATIIFPSKEGGKPVDAERLAEVVQQRLEFILVETGPLMNGIGTRAFPPVYVKKPTIRAVLDGCLYPLKCVPSDPRKRERAIKAKVIIPLVCGALKVDIDDLTKVRDDPRFTELFKKLRKDKKKGNGYLVHEHVASVMMQTRRIEKAQQGRGNSVPAEVVLCDISEEGSRNVSSRGGKASQEKRRADKAAGSGQAAAAASK